MFFVNIYVYAQTINIISILSIKQQADLDLVAADVMATTAMALECRGSYDTGAA